MKGVSFWAGRGAWHNENPRNLPSIFECRFRGSTRGHAPSLLPHIESEEGDEGPDERQDVEQRQETEVDQRPGDGCAEGVVRIGELRRLGHIDLRLWRSGHGCACRTASLGVDAEIESRVF